MKLKMWSYDLAREQAPTLDHLYEIASLTLDSGYNALGLYLEHRFAYPSLPWAAGKGSVTPDMVAALQSEFPSLQVIPMINLLGHFEGFLYTEKGKQYREELFTGLQASPANPAFIDVCHKIIEDTLQCFSADIIHIGGDETQQLGASVASKERMEALQTQYPRFNDKKAILYGAHFGPLAEQVVKAGRRPAVWGDMFEQHPEALDFLPKSTLIFDWQYFNGVAESSKKFTDQGFDVVGCPAIQTYNACWMHVEATEKNILEISDDVNKLGLHGVCVTTWELAMMGAYDTIFPSIKSAGQTLNQMVKPIYEAYHDVSPQHEQWARMMSQDLSKIGGTFAPGKIRSSLKVRLLLNANPFLCWMHHREEFCDTENGKKAVDLLNHALQIAPTEAEKGVTLFTRSAVEFVMIADAARQLYSEGKVEATVAKLSSSRQIFDELAKRAKWTNQRIGGSLADIERCRIAKEHIEMVMQRIRRYGDGSLGYLPAFEHITHHKFCPHDQAAWWLINKWANQ